VKKINGPTCKLTLFDIVIENFGITFTNIHTVVGSKWSLKVNFMI